MPSPDGIVLESGFNRLKRCRCGPMLYNRNDTFIGRALDIYGEAHQMEVDLLTKLVKSGQVVLDVGANIGVLTLPLAQKVGPKGAVIAFEPQRIVFQTLSANIALNGLPNVRGFEAAVGRARGSVKVPPLDYSAERNFGGIGLEGVARGELVPRVSIDDLALKICHLIKIDVEGMEADVIEGARRTLGRHQPLLYVENDRRAKSPDLIRLLTSLNYRLYWHFPRLYNPNNFFGVGKNVFGDIVSVNMLCLPAGDRRQVRGIHPVGGPDDDWREVIKRRPPA